MNGKIVDDKGVGTEMRQLNKEYERGNREDEKEEDIMKEELKTILCDLTIATERPPLVGEVLR
jgi:hypothetical protein